MIYLSRFNALIQSLDSIFNPWIHLATENILLRQELVALKQQQGLRQHISLLNKMWSWLLIHLSPGILTKLHRILKCIYWKHVCRNSVTGRPGIDIRIRRMIKQMLNDNPTWGAPRIHGELLKLGFIVSERSVSRYLKRFKPQDSRRRTPGWLTFRRNHSREITAMDFAVVPKKIDSFWGYLSSHGFVGFQSTEGCI